MTEPVTTMEAFVLAAARSGRWSVGLTEEAKARIAGGEPAPDVFASILERLKPGVRPPQFQR